MHFDVLVVGGGLAGLSAAFEIRRLRPDLSLLVLEREAAPGGKVRSTTRDAFTFDWGPNGFQPAPVTLDLVRSLGLESRLLPASREARKRYLFRDGGLRPLPGRPQEILSSELLSPVGKARLLAEPLIPRGRVEETVAGFAARRFGPEAARIAGAMVLGISAGDARKLSLDALLPAARRMEREHGSILRALSKAPRRGPGPALYSFPSGMGELTAALARQLGGALRSGAQASSLEREGDRYRLGLATGESLTATRLVLATPAFEAGRLLAPLLPEAAATLAAIPYPPVDVFALVFDRIDVPHPLDGFGFLVPRGERVRSLGVLWTSSLFADRTSQGTVLLRVIAGGAVDAEFGGLGDERALAEVRRDLELTMGIVEAPLSWERVHHERAIPQYEVGHASRVAGVMSAVRALGGLALAGNAYFGIGVNDCIRDAGRVAAEVLS